MKTQTPPINSQLDSLILTDYEEDALRDLVQFPLVDAIFGRRSRRFFRGAEIPDGPLAFKSRHAPLPLTELERLLILLSVAGNTGWHDAITRHERYKPHLANYSGAAGGRVFPSAAGFHTSEIFFTDDSGTYFFPTRDAPALTPRNADGTHDLRALLNAHHKRIVKLSDARIHMPDHEPYMTGHNSWVANKPGSLLVIPVGDVAQQLLLTIAFFNQNGYGLYDDVHRRPIPGLDKFAHLVDLSTPYMISSVERYALNGVTSELSIAAYAGSLMQQAMGLGGWVFNGIDRLKMLGASGNPAVPGLGFRYDTDPRWTQPNATGLAGVFEAYTPPHFPDMRAAVDALAARKFGAGGPFHADTPGAWKDSAAIRASAKPWTDEFRDMVALQAQYIFDTFGKFPGTVPTLQIMLYLQSHHLDLEYYDCFYEPGAYLRTHAEHLQRWHGVEE
jgi:hypothetical protein